MAKQNHYHKHTIVSGGLKLSVHESGIGDIPCVFIHGLADGGHVWEGIVGEVTSYFRSYVIDLRGHGESDWDTAKNYSLESYVADVEIILDQLRLEKYILVGHSLGGSIATRIIDRRPNEVLGAILVDTSPSVDEEVSKYLREQLLESYKLYDSVEEYSDWLQEQRPLVSQQVAQQLARNSLLTLPTGQYRLKFDLDVFSNLADGVDDPWLWSRLVHFSQPILLIRGSGSAILSKQIANLVVGKLQRGKLATVDLAGHSVMSDNPLAFISVAKSFLSTFRRIH